MTLDEIKKAVDAGHTVHWSTPAYTVIPDKLKSGMRYLIAYKHGTLDAHYWGLTKMDGTMNEEPHKFYIAGKTPAMTSEQFIRTIARMVPYSIDSSDDILDDAVATLNRLIHEAKNIKDSTP